MAGRFARVETRRRARGLLLGLLADLPQKNCWSLAEHAGDTDPHGMQHLLNRAVWDTDGVRDDLRDYVTIGLGDADAVLVVDETGDLARISHYRRQETAREWTYQPERKLVGELEAGRER